MVFDSGGGPDRPASADGVQVGLSSLPSVGFVIRPADAPQLATLHAAAFPTFFLSSLGERFLSEFYCGFADDPSAVVVVQRDLGGRPVGVAVGTVEPDRFFSRLLRRRLWGFLRAAAGAAAKNPRAIGRLVRAVVYRGDPGDAHAGALLSSICVDPALGGRGHGRRLIEAWERRAYALGARSAYLTTDAIGNARTNRFYVESGWTLSDSFATPEGRAMNRYVRGLRRGDEPNEEDDA